MQSSLEKWLAQPKTVKQPLPGGVKENSTTSKPHLALSDPADGPNIRQDESPPPPRESGSDKNGASLRAPRKCLPMNVHFRQPSKEDMINFKRLNTLLLPIPYPESFYKETIKDPVTNSLSLFAFWQDTEPTDQESGLKGRLIGAVRCRLLASPPGAPRKDGPMLYLSTLVLLSPYRSLGIASYMLDTLLKRAVQEYDVTSVGAHVWEANELGLDWYRRRGFKEIGRTEDYYNKLKPRGAVTMLRDIGVLDLTGN